MARKRAASTPSPRRPARRQRRRVVYEDESKNIDTNSEDFGSEFANVSDESTDSMSLYEPESPESTPKLSNVRKGSSGQSSGWSSCIARICSFANLPRSYSSTYLR
jgi:hypothetical protein